METNYEKYRTNLGTVWIIDEETGIEFYEYPENPIYWISKCSKVYNSEKDIFLTQTVIQSGKGYYTVTLNRKRTRVHRMLATTFLNNPNNYPLVDHINLDSLDNSLENLRWASYSMNNRNVTKSLNRSSKYMGVCKTYNNKWRVQCLHKYHGTFNTEIEAAEAYNKIAEQDGVLHLNKIEKNKDE